jgi:hypothetical protein
MLAITTNPPNDAEKIRRSKSVRIRIVIITKRLNDAEKKRRKRSAILA